MMSAGVISGLGVALDDVNAPLGFSLYGFAGLMVTIAMVLANREYLQKLFRRTKPDIWTPDVPIKKRVKRPVPLWVNIVAAGYMASIFILLVVGDYWVPSVTNAAGGMIAFMILVFLVLLLFSLLTHVIVWLLRQARFKWRRHRGNPYY